MGEILLVGVWINSLAWVSTVMLQGQGRPAIVANGAHGRRKFFVLADLGKSPLVLEAVCRIEVMLAIKLGINGIAAARAARQDRIRPMVGEFATCMR